MTTISSVQAAVLGACNIDFILKVPRFAGADDEVDVEEMHLSLGGSAANFAVRLSRMGVKTGIIARVGYDHFGDFMARKFKEEKVETQRLLKIHAPTGMAFIAVDNWGERSIYASMGANAEFKLQKEDIKYIQRSEILHITGMYKEVIEEVSKHAKLLSFNPGTIISAYGLDSLSKIIKKTHILFLNKKEVSLLTQRNFEEGASLLVDMGVDMVIVTCGGRGVNLYTEGDVIHSSTRNLKSLDTTGAGDAFAAGFIASFIKNKNPEECLQFGNIQASKCVGELGAINIPKTKDLDF